MAESRGLRGREVQVNKCTKEEHRKRLSEVAALLLSGYLPSQIINHCGQYYGVKRRQAQKYISAAYSTFESGLPETLEKKRALQTARLTICYQEADDVSDKVRALDGIAKIQGLYAPKKVAETNIEGDALASKEIEAMQEVLKTLSIEELKVMSRVNGKVEEIVQAKGAG